jgi:hypothetical protein
MSNNTGRPLKAIVDDLERLKEECSQWCDDNVTPRLMACETLAEVKEIHLQLSRECDADDSHIRDIPTEIHLAIVSRLREIHVNEFYNEQ